jgi:XTP/dITP diphosphohydrolase
VRIVLATGNANKARELQPLLGGAQVEPAPAGFDVEETGTTLFQNALLKATALRGQVDPTALVVADDTGLCVRALGGRPGVYSARYAGESASYSDNNRLLLDELDGADDRAASFVCVLVALAGEGDMRIGCGVLPGTIALAPRGDGGFGYDPLFVPAGSELSMAEMTLEAKGNISHRGRAARSLCSSLGLVA